jgi:hypothetical protein
VPPGSYVACAKNAHTLRNCTAVTVTSAGALVDFGTLSEGDSDDDNCVALVDFSILSTSFATCDPSVGFDPRADFNEDGCIVLLDFSLLSNNFGACGDDPPGTETPAPSQAAQ